MCVLRPFVLRRIYGPLLLSAYRVRCITIIRIFIRKDHFCVFGPPTIGRVLMLLQRLRLFQYHRSRLKVRVQRHLRRQVNYTTVFRIACRISDRPLGYPLYLRSKVRVRGNLQEILVHSIAYVRSEGEDRFQNMT